MSAATKPKEALGAGQLRQLLRLRHRGDAWAFFEEVPNATGYAKSRTADAIAMSLWPSRGLEIHGFELKVSRGDWIKEMREPEKADAIGRYCDRWWLVLGDRNLVKPGEVPGGWGILAPRGDALVAIVDAPALSPAMLDRTFLAAMLRAADGHAKARIAEVVAPGKEEIDAAYRKGFEQGSAVGARGLEAALKDAKFQREKIQAFHEATGIDLGEYVGIDRAREIGNIVRLITRGPHNRAMLPNLVREASMLRDLATHLEQIQTEISKLHGEDPR